MGGKGGSPPQTPQLQKPQQPWAQSLLDYSRGGVVPGYPGQPQMGVLHGGETVVPTRDGLLELLRLIGV